MVTLGTNILILFGIAAALAFFFPAIRDGVFKELSGKTLGASVKPLVLVLVPFAALFGFAGLLGAPVNLTLPCFTGAAVLSFVLAGIGLTPLARAVLLTVASVVLSIFLPADGGNIGLAAALMGLLVAKVAFPLCVPDAAVEAPIPTGERPVPVTGPGGSPIAANSPMVPAAESPLVRTVAVGERPGVTNRGLEDIIAPMSWLAGVLFLSTLEDTSSLGVQQSLLLGVISICFLLRVIQRPFMTDDRWCLKRIILATSGGLAVLIVITKLLLAVTLTPLAILVGAGMFAAYMFKNIDVYDADDKPSAPSGITMLIVIGLFIIVATRFWGLYGLVLLAPLSMLAPIFSMGQLFGLFFSVRVLMQVFIALYNPNVTGINITHAYTSAAQYAGFIVLAVLALMTRDVVNRRLLTALLLGAAAVTPIASNYYLHAEPTSSLLVASAVAGVIFAVLGPAFARGNRVAPFENLLLVPAMMSAVAITYNGLIDAGANATNEVRATFLAYAIGAAIVCFIVGWFVFKNLDKKRAIPATGE